MATNERVAKARRKDSAKTIALSPKNTETVSCTNMEPCPDCNLSVNEHDKAVSCDICDFWFHKTCQGISDQLYKVLTSQETDSISWFCSGCKRGAKKVMLQLTRLRERQDVVESKMDNIEKRQVETTNKLEVIEDRVEKLESQERAVVTDLGQPSLAVKEIEERERRKNNVVLFNVPESSSQDPKLRHADDVAKFKTLCQSNLDVEPAEVDTAYRLGPKSKNGNICRPLKVQLTSNVTKKQILSNAKKLRATGDSANKQIAIAHDLTPMQREEIKRLRELQKTRQEELKQSGDTLHIWIIRDRKLMKVKVKQS